MVLRVSGFVLIPNGITHRQEVAVMEEEVSVLPRNRRHAGVSLRSAMQGSPRVGQEAEGVGWVGDHLYAVSVGRGRRQG